LRRPARFDGRGVAELRGAIDVDYHRVGRDRGGMVGGAARTGFLGIEERGCQPNLSSQGAGE
jgi:hypothetical protein